MESRPILSVRTILSIAVPIRLSRVSGGRCFLFAGEFEKLVEAEFKVRRRSGRRRKHDWDEGELFGKEQLKTKGDPTKPENQEKGWESQADLARAIMAHMAKYSEDGEEPPFSTAQELAARLLKDFNG